MASAAGIECDVDPLLFSAMRSHCSTYLLDLASTIYFYMLYNTPHCLASMYTVYIIAVTCYYFWLCEFQCPFCLDKSLDDKQIWFLFLVFVGVYLPELAMRGESRFLPSLEGLLLAIYKQRDIVIH